MMAAFMQPVYPSVFSPLRNLETAPVVAPSGTVVLMKEAETTLKTAALL
jgi:hypothetical protein